MAARHCRYEFFDMIGRAEQLKIATGHTANDQAETVLHHMLRGTGIDGLKGIPVQRDRFIRPLLFAQRQHLERYARATGLSWREDSTNVDESYTRNRIRHTLLPLLKEQFNPQIIKALVRLSESALDSSQIIQQAGHDAYESCANRRSDGKIVLEIDRFLAYFKSLQRLVLQHVFEAFGVNPLLLSFNKFENVLAFLKKQQSGAAYAIRDDFYLYVSGKAAIFTQNSQSAQEVLVMQHVPGRVEIREGLFLEIMHHTKPLTLKSKNRHHEFIDADKLSIPVCVRSYKKADVFYPVNGVGKKSVSDFFIDHKVPYVDRLTTPILESAGKIVWICGFRLDDRFKVTEKTKRIYKLTIRTRERANGF
jgi:tRNA(Ile)-lysidine synthase